TACPWRRSWPSRARATVCQSLSTTRSTLSSVEADLEAASELERPALQATLQRLRLQVADDEHDLALLDERDAIQATRPEGCCCLAAAGRGREGFLPPLPDAPDDWYLVDGA